MKGFISYAHKDEALFKVLVDGIKSHSSGSKLIDWELWTDKAILIGEDWHESIQTEIEESKFAILFLSANFFASHYIQEHEFGQFIRKKKQEGYLFFPILVSDFDFQKFEAIAKFQFFKAKGDEYGFPQEKMIPFDRLVSFTKDLVPIPNSYLPTYFKNLVKAIEKAISTHNFRQLSPYKDARIRKDYGLQPEITQLNPLQEAIQLLDIKSPVLRDLHRVNCDRVNLIGDFWRFFDKNKKSNLLFFNIIADELHQPESFSERLIYELDEDLTKKNQSIYYKPHPVHGIEKYKIKLHLEEKGKRDFKTGFSKMVIPEQDHTLIIDSLEDFLSLDSPTLQHDYIALIFSFEIYAKKDLFKEYLKWIRKSFFQIQNSKTKFLVFLVFSLPYQPNAKKNKFEHLIKTVKNASGKNRENTLLINKFSSVRTEDLVRWFSNHLATRFEAEEIVEKIVNHIDESFSSKMASRFFDKENEAFQMDFVQKVLNDVCKLNR